MAPRKTKKEDPSIMPMAIIESLDLLEKERGISKEAVIESIEKGLAAACEHGYGKDANVECSLNRETGEIDLYVTKEIVEVVTNPNTEVSIEVAKAIDESAEVGGAVAYPIESKEVSRTAAQKARNIIIQAINEGEKFAIYNKFSPKEKKIITGTITRILDDKYVVFDKSRNIDDVDGSKKKDFTVGVVTEVKPRDKKSDKNEIVVALRDGSKNTYKVKDKYKVGEKVYLYLTHKVYVALDDRTETALQDSEQVWGERYRVGDRIKLYVVEVTKPVIEDPATAEENKKDGRRNNKKKSGFRIQVSRSHPDLVRKLFEQEVTEIPEGVVEIKSISREAGSRTKIAVYSNNPDVDAVGACVGFNGQRVNNVVDDLQGEKIDIINWDEDPAKYIENSLSPSDVVAVKVNIDEKSARVVVPNNKLSLAIGKEGQNARLAARLTGYKIDIKSVDQAEETGFMDDYDDDAYYEEDYEDEYYDDEEYTDEVYDEDVAEKTESSEEE